MLPNKNNATQKKKKNKSDVVKSQLVNIKEQVKSAKLYRDSNVDHAPLKLYLANLLASGHDKVITPLNPMKVFVKRVNYQDSLTVNSNGHAIVILQPAALQRWAITSTASPVLYSNSSVYDPNSNTNGVSGGWNTNFISQAGLNLISGVFSKVRVQSLHLTVQLTGVSNYNKKGTIHIAEDVDDKLRFGIATDAQYNNFLINDFSLGDLPKKNHYKSLEIMNMDSESVVKYNYMPLTNHDQAAKYQTPLVNTASNGAYVEPEKRFGLIVQGADPATTVRLIYQIDLECEVETDYYNDYPPSFSRCYIDTEPMLQYLSRNTDNILVVEKTKRDITGPILNMISNLGSN